MIEKKDCLGCIDDYYNGKNTIGVTECWMFKDAEIVSKFRLHRDSSMNNRNNYQEVQKPKCYREKNFVFLGQIPEYAK